MPTDGTRSASEDLQFDRVVNDGSTNPAQVRPAVVCASCEKQIATEYFHLNGKVSCASCRDSISAAVSTPKGAAPLGRAAGLGLLAAIAGAAIYYGIIAILDLEIGFVAILIGYMVGWSVRKGANGRGGRRFQVLAIVLTYWAVGLAYLPIFIKASGENEKTHASASSDSTGARAPDAASATPVPAARRGDSVKAVGATASAAKKDDMGAGLAILTLFFYVFALPVIVIVAGGGSGLISAFIIAIGMRQAWHMTAAPELKITGPYRVGRAASPATS